MQNFTAMHAPDGAVSHNGLIIAEKHSFTNHHTMLEPAVVSKYINKKLTMVQNFTATHSPHGAVSHNGLIIAEKHSFTNHHTMLEPAVVSEY